MHWPVQTQLCLPRQHIEDTSNCLLIRPQLQSILNNPLSELQEFIGIRPKALLHPESVSGEDCSNQEPFVDIGPTNLIFNLSHSLPCPDMGGAYPHWCKLPFAFTDAFAHSLGLLASFRNEINISNPRTAYTVHIRQNRVRKTNLVFHILGTILGDSSGFRISFDLQSLKGTSLTFSD